MQMDKGYLAQKDMPIKSVNDRISMQSVMQMRSLAGHVQHADWHRGRTGIVILTLQVGQARNSLLQSMLAQLRCGNSGSPPHRAQLVAAGSVSGADPSSLPVYALLVSAVR